MVVSEHFEKQEKKLAKIIVINKTSFTLSSEGESCPSSKKKKELGKTKKFKFGLLDCFVFVCRGIEKIRMKEGLNNDFFFFAYWMLVVMEELLGL
jgi:hypothetical protein